MFKLLVVTHIASQHGAAVHQVVVEFTTEDAANAAYNALYERAKSYGLLSTAAVKLW